MARLPLNFDDQPPLPCARAQTAWQVLLRQVNGGATKAVVHDYYQQGKGFIHALDVAEVIVTTEEHVMSATLLHAWIDALERLDDAAEAVL